MSEQSPLYSKASARIPRVDQQTLLSRLSYFCGFGPSPIGHITNLNQSYDAFDRSLEQNHPNLAKRRLGMSAAILWAENGGSIPTNAPDNAAIESTNDAGQFYNLFTIGYGLIEDTYRRVKQPMPPDTEQGLWFDREPKLTGQDFFDCLELAQFDITEKYPALQLALQSFVKSKRIASIHPSPRAPAFASIAASELFDGFTQMEVARANE